MSTNLQFKQNLQTVSHFQNGKRKLEKNDEELIINFNLAQRFGQYCIYESI